MEGGGEANDDGGAVTDGIGVTEADGSDAITIIIRCSNGKKFAVQVSLQSSVKLFRSVLEQTCDVPTEKLILVYNGRILKDDQTLTNYGLEADHTVHVVGGFPPAESDNTANTGDDGTMGGSGDSSSEFDLEAIQQWWSDRMTPDKMYRLMNNPDGIRNSPQLMEQVNRNPYLPSIINDSINFRESAFKDIIYPELCREMLRYVYRRGGGDVINQEMLQSLLSNPHDIITMLKPQVIENSQNPGSIPQMASPETIQVR